MSYTILESGKYQCDVCGWEGSRSGYYKHRKIHQSTEEKERLDEEVESVEIPIADSNVEEEDSSRS